MTRRRVILLIVAIFFLTPFLLVSFDMPYYQQGTTRQTAEPRVFGLWDHNEHQGFIFTYDDNYFHYIGPELLPNQFRRQIVFHASWRPSRIMIGVLTVVW